MDNTETINILSLCTGYGGMELALGRILNRPMRVVAVEIEAYAAANLVAKAEQGKLAIEALYTDVKTFPSRKFRGCFDIITAGYPCQPFSNAGKRQGRDDPRHLWPFIRKHINAIRPVYCIFENVAGHVTLGFQEVCQDLWAMGYKVEAGLFTAAEVGAPHKRERLFIMAYSGRQRRRGWNNGIHGGQNGALQVERPSKLDVTKSLRSQRLSESGQGWAEFNEPSELANANGSRSRQDRQQCELRSSCFGESPCNQGNCEQEQEIQRRWPARPGQEQYEWEEPRTVESGLGKSVDGFKSRVDRLRLLGNGIILDQAEKAIRYLFERAVKNESII